MKVIDLLNKIANGEDVPKKIAIRNEVLIYNEDEIINLQDCYYTEDDKNATWKIWAYKLDDEIEIIEDTPKEDKKIKRIQSCGDTLYSEYIGEWLIRKELYTEYDELLMNKINEIIDRLNGEE